MAVTLIGLSGASWGITTAETAANVENYTLEVEPEINEWVPGIDGQARGKVVGDAMGKLNIDGDVLGSTGPIGATFATAFVPNGSTTAFGRTTGGFYLDRGTISQNRSALKKFSTEFSSRTGVA